MAWLGTALLTRVPVGMGFNDLNDWPAGVQLSRIWDIGAHWGASRATGSILGSLGCTLA